MSRGKRKSKGCIVCGRKTGRMLELNETYICSTKCKRAYQDKYGKLPENIVLGYN